MAKLENMSRAIVEAYLKNDLLTKGEFSEKTELKLTVSTQNTEESASTATASVSPQPLYLLDVMQNFILHIFVASQVNNKIYDKLNSIGPRKTSTRFMAETVKTTERYSLNSHKKPTPRRDDAIWKATSNYEPHRVAQPRKQQRPNATQIRATGQKNDKSSTICFTCKQTGHYKHQCTKCAYCRQEGHASKNCTLRIKNNKGKYCTNCKITDSHNTSECRRQANTGSRNAPRHNARMASSSNDQVFEYTEYLDDGQQSEETDTSDTNEVEL